MAACKKVLQNFELMECILLQASAYDIMVSTSVCASWRAVVENSIPLREYVVTLPARKPDPHRARSSNTHYKLNDSAESPWHFMVKTTNESSLFVLRLPQQHLEIFLLAPFRANSHLKVLDQAYDVYAVDAQGQPNLEFCTKYGEKMCRTKSKAFQPTRPRRKGGSSRVTPAEPEREDAIRGDVLRRYLITFYGENFDVGKPVHEGERPSGRLIPILSRLPGPIQKIGIRLLYRR